MTWNKGKGLAVKFIRDFADYQGDDCILWPFSKSNGYGTFSDNGVAHYAHRYMCTLVNGPPPTPSHEAAHSCGWGHFGCISPKHLSWKTTSENQLDRSIHGTKNVWGSRGKLTQEQADQIRALSGRKPQREIALMFGVSRSTVSWVVTGKTWRGHQFGVKATGSKWQARIKISGQDFWLGMFESEDAARAAYRTADESARAALTKGEREK